MSQDDLVRVSTDLIVGLFLDAQRNIEAQQARILAMSPAERKRWKRREDRLGEMRASIDRELNSAMASYGSWSATDWHGIYGLGVQEAQKIVVGRFDWTQIHLGAVEAIAQETFEEVLAATEFVRDDTKRWIREMGRRTTAGTIIEGRTAEEAARDLARRGAKELDNAGDPEPISLVYKNGAKHTLGDYTQMLIRTKTAVAYNMGTINFATSQGVTRFEVFDGQDCSWPVGHGAANANGRIVTAQQAASNPIAHPGAIMGGQSFQSVGIPTEIVRSQYVGPSITITTAEGHRLTVSPDHPISTLTGWVGASRLKPGDRILADRATVETNTSSDINQQRTIDQVFDAVSKSFPTSTAIPSPDHLHNAAKFCDPEVDVIDVERLLREHGISAITERLSQKGLIVRDPHLCSFDGDGPFALTFDVDSPAASCVVCRSSQGHSFGFTTVGHAVAHGFASCHYPKSVAIESRTESRIGDSEFDCEIGQSFTAGVPSMDIFEATVIELSMGWHVGPVYDATTLGASYLTSGVLVANCRRAFGARPDLDGLAQVEEFDPSTTAEQRAAQGNAEVARARRLAARRSEREARKQRSKRNRSTTTPPVAPSPQVVSSVEAELMRRYNDEGFTFADALLEDAQTFNKRAKDAATVRSAADYAMTAIEAQNPAAVSTFLRAAANVREVQTAATSITIKKARRGYPAGSYTARYARLFLEMNRFDVVKFEKRVDKYNLAIDEFNSLPDFERTRQRAKLLPSRPTASTAAASVEDIGGTMIHELVHTIDNDVGRTLSAKAGTDGMYDQVVSIHRGQSEGYDLFAYASTKPSEAVPEITRMYFEGSGGDLTGTQISAEEWRKKYPGLADWVEENVIGAYQVAEQNGTLLR